MLHSHLVPAVTGRHDEDRLDLNSFALCTWLPCGLCLARPGLVLSFGAFAA
jgi:hypothetical protein